MGSATRPARACETWVDDENPPKSFRAVGAIGIEPTTPTVSRRSGRVGARSGSFLFNGLPHTGVCRRSTPLDKSGAPSGAPNSGAPLGGILTHGHYPGRLRGHGTRRSCAGPRGRDRPPTSL
jgi:hypothetical protein